MKRLVTALLVAAETFAIATGTLALIALPVLLAWTVSFGLSGDPLAVFSLIGNLWFFGNGVPLSISLTATAAAGLGLPPSALTATFSLIPLGFVLFTGFWASRVGKRLAALDPVTAATGALSGIGTLAVLSLLLQASIPQPTLSYPPFGAAMIPVLIFTLGMGTGYLVESVRESAPWCEQLRARARTWVRPAWHWAVRGLVLGSQAALVTLLALTAVSALVFGLRLMTQYVSVVALSQQLQVDVLGTLFVFIATLTYLPTLLIWTLSWMIGPGFAIGAGSSVSALSTQLGPIPSVPVFGILPTGSHPWGLAFVSVILVSAIVGTATALRRSLSAGEAPPRLSTLALMVFASGVVAFLALAMLFWAATGSIGPGRLEIVGPDPWLAAGIGAAELMLGSVVGAWLTLLDWSHIADQTRTRASVLTQSRLGLGVQRVTERFRRDSSPAASSDVAAEESASTAQNRGAPTHESGENDAQDTVELSDFRPWWPDKDDKL